MIPALNSLNCPVCRLPYNAQDRQPHFDICTHTRCKACFDRTVGQLCQIADCPSILTGHYALNGGLLDVVKEVGDLRKKALVPPAYSSLAAAVPESSPPAYGSLAAPHPGPAAAPPAASAPSPAPVPYSGFVATQQNQFEQAPFSAESIGPNRAKGISLWQLVEISSPDAQAKLQDQAPGNFILGYTPQQFGDWRGPHITYRLNFVPKKRGPAQERLIKVVFLPKNEAVFSNIGDKTYDEVEISVWNKGSSVYQKTLRRDRRPSGDSPVYLSMRPKVPPTAYERFEAYKHEGFWRDFPPVFETIMDQGL